MPMGVDQAASNLMKQLGFYNTQRERETERERERQMLSNYFQILKEEQEGQEEGKEKFSSNIKYKIIISSPCSRY